jgi:hypothetical protein
MSSRKKICPPSSTIALAYTMRTGIVRVQVHLLFFLPKRVNASLVSLNVQSAHIASPVGRGAIQKPSKNLSDCDAAPYYRFFFVRNEEAGSPFSFTRLTLGLVAYAAMLKWKTWDMARRLRFERRCMGSAPCNRP